MANYNKVILVGNLTRDPQMSMLPSNTPVVEIGLAVNRRWRGQDGEQREETCFIDCRAFGRQAEVMNQYLSKGRPVLIEGRLTFDTWEGKDGSRRSKHRVTVERFQFLGGGGDGGAPRGGGQRNYQQAAPARPQQGGSQQGYGEPQPPQYDDDMGGGEDIPF